MWKRSSHTWVYFFLPALYVYIYIMLSTCEHKIAHMYVCMYVIYKCRSKNVYVCIVDNFIQRTMVCTNALVGPPLPLTRHVTHHQEGLKVPSSITPRFCVINLTPPHPNNSSQPYLPHHLHAHVLHLPILHLHFFPPITI